MSGFDDAWMMEVFGSMWYFGATFGGVFLRIWLFSIVMTSTEAVHCTIIIISRHINRLRLIASQLVLSHDGLFHFRI
jgi:hypothetical protein